ncbi:MAG: cation diffusion facilitator family transporter [Thermodesulfobacteriota bacterium]
MKNHEAPETIQSKERTALFGTVAKTVLLLPSLFAAILSGSLLLYTDLVKNVVDTLAIFVSWRTLRTMNRGAASSYDFGFGKLESLTSLLVSFTMAVSVLAIVASALERLEEPVALQNVWLGLLMVLASAGEDVYFWRKYEHINRKGPSPLAEANLRAYRTDLVLCLGVAASLTAGVVLKRFSWIHYLDPAMSLAYAFYILAIAYGIFTKSLFHLGDKTLEESLQILILRELSRFFHEFDKFHGIRSRHSGNVIYIEIFLEFDPARTMGEVQGTMDRLAENLESAIDHSSVLVVPTTRRVN